MNDETRQALQAGAKALQEVELRAEDMEVTLPLILRNVAAVSKLAPRIAFEDEPALYAPMIERVKG